MEHIPSHNFSRDDKTSIPFKAIPLKTKTYYDASVAHRHNYYEIFLFTKGGGKHAIDFVAHDILDHSVHFVSPGQVHLVERNPDSFGLILLFSRDFYHQKFNSRDILFDMPFLNNAEGEPLLNLSAEVYRGFLELAEGMKREWDFKEGLYEDALRNYLDLFLINGKRHYPVNPVEHSQNADQHKSLYIDFRRVLEQNFSDTHLVKTYAQLCETTERKLGEAVKQLSGHTPLQMIHNRLILEAKRLLNHGGFSVKEAAFALGFEAPAHFSKFFKAKTGQSPSDFPLENVN